MNLYSSGTLKLKFLKQQEIWPVNGMYHSVSRVLSTDVLTPMVRSYLEGLKLGFLTQDPSQVHDPHVCDSYKANSTGSARRHPDRRAHIHRVSKLSH